MTEEEVRAMLSSEEGQSILSEMGLISREEAEEKNQGLINKKNELLAKIADPKWKEAKQKAKLLDEILAESEADSPDDVINMFQKAKNPEEPEEVRQMRREYKKMTEDYSTLSEEYKTAETAIRKNMVDNVFVSSLQNEGCTKRQAEAVASYILGHSKFDLINDSGSRKAVNDMGLTPEDYFSEWVKTDEALELLPAKRNTGAGAHGNRGGGMERDFNAELKAANERGDRTAVIRLTREAQEAAAKGRR